MENTKQEKYYTTARNCWSSMDNHASPVIDCSMETKSHMGLLKICLWTAFRCRQIRVAKWYCEPFKCPRFSFHKLYRLLSSILYEIILRTRNWLCVYNSWPLFRNYLLPIVGTSLIQTQIVTITQTEIEHVKTETQNCYKYIKDYNISGKDMDIHIQDTKKTTQDLFNYATFLVFVTRSNSFSSVQVIWEAWKVLSL